MKKKFFPLLFVAALGGMTVTSCTEVLEANVSYSHTYTNDYSKLVEAINNMSNTLEQRISSLNSLLENKLADIKVSIDENTGAITAQTTSLQNSLDGINGTLGTTNQNIENLRVSLLDGFGELKTTMTENGNKLVTAINNNGEIIAAKLDKNNQLIETEVVGKLSDLNATLADGNAKMDAKMEALNNLLSSGLVKMDATNAELGKIGTGLTGLQTSVDGVKTQIQSVDGTLGKMNTNLDTANGKLDGISTAIQGTNGQLESLNTSMGTLNTNVKDLSKELSEDFVTLGTVIATNDQLIVEAINKEGEILKLGFDANSENFKKLNEEMASVNKNITDVNGNIVKTYQELEKMNTNIGSANTTLGNINSNLSGVKDNIATANGKLEAISSEIQKLDASISSETSGLPALIKAQQNLKLAIDNANTGISGKIDALTTKEAENAQKIVDAIEKLLNDEGIYLPTDNSDNKIYMTYSAFTELEAAGESSSSYKAILGQLKEHTVNIVCAQKVNSSNAGMPAAGTSFYGSGKNYDNYHDHFQFVEESREADVLVAGNYGVNSLSGTTRKTYEVIRTPGDIKYKAVLSNTNCFGKYIWGYAIKDARGITRETFTTPKSMELTNMTAKCAANGTIVDEIQLIVYCDNASHSNNASYQEGDFNYCSDSSKW